jgi:hypothetical protein
MRTLLRYNYCVRQVGGLASLIPPNTAITELPALSSLSTSSTVFQNVQPLQVRNSPLAMRIGDAACSVSPDVLRHWRLLIGSAIQRIVVGAAVTPSHWGQPFGSKRQSFHGYQVPEVLLLLDNVFFGSRCTELFPARLMWAN